MTLELRTAMEDSLLEGPLLVSRKALSTCVWFFVLVLLAVRSIQVSMSLVTTSTGNYYWDEWKMNNVNEKMPREAKEKKIDNNIANVPPRVDEPAKEKPNAAKPKRNAVVFVCNERYGNATASSTVSLRRDGGYEEDVVIIMDESKNFTKSWLEQELVNQGGGPSALERVYIFTAAQLFKQMLHKSNKYLREPPAPASCLNDQRRKGHRAYYLKALIFHKTIADQWDTVLFMDSCMTFHSPHINEILQMPEVEGHVLAAPDPWWWGKKMIGGRVLPCAKKKAKHAARKLVGKDLKEASYFNTAFILYDTAIVRDYHPGDKDNNRSSSSSSTLIELLKVYHKVGPAFKGNQDIFSIYWVYMRKQYRLLPLSMFGSPRIPYEFKRRMRREPYVVTSGNADRSVCLDRPTNKMNLKRKRKKKES